MGEATFICWKETVWRGFSMSKEPRKPDYSQWKILMGFFLLCSCTMIWATFNSREEVLALHNSNKLLKTSGTITRSDIRVVPLKKSGGGQTCLNMSYRYMVATRNFKGDRLDFSGDNCGIREGAELILEFAARYQAGERVDVFYVPGRPEISAIHPQSGRFPTTPIVFLTSVFSMGFCFLSLVWLFLKDRQ